ncbi:MAG TPA: acyl-ACP thioesterase domain-containing protein [Anaerovoracaceae bacterium]|nr:acyl-ACP thioesterase domain-containing protein [Anaerovoracaceae bacterium]
MKYGEYFNITSHDIDFNSVVRPEQLQMYMQEAADHQSRDQAIECEKLYNMGYTFIVSRMNVEIFKPIKKYDRVLINTWHIKGRAANFPRAYEVIRNGEILASAMSNWALVKVDTKKLVKYDDYDMSMYDIDEPLELNIKSRFRIPKELGFEEVDKHIVKLSDTDINRHMNNTKYLKIIYDNIPNMQNSFITSINIRYMKEAKLKDNISIYRSEERSSLNIDIRADKVYNFYTKIDDKLNMEAEIGIRGA